MRDMRHSHPAVAARRAAVPASDSARGLGVVLAAALAAGALGAIVLATGGGILAALFAYSFGASLLVGSAAVAVALRDAGFGRVANALMHRSRLHRLPS